MGGQLRATNTKITTSTGMELWRRRKRSPVVSLFVNNKDSFSPGISNMLSSISFLLWALAMDLPKASAAPCTFPSDPSCTAYVFFRMQPGQTIKDVSENLFRQNYLNVLDAKNWTATSSIINPGEEEILIPLKCSCNQRTGSFQAIPSYQILPGDTLYVLASSKYQYLTSIQDIATASGIDNINFIAAGAVLNIPIPCACNRVASGGNAQYASYVTYVPKGPAESDSEIAATFRTTAEALRIGNNVANKATPLQNQPLIVPTPIVFPALMFPALPPAQPNCSFANVCKSAGDGKGFPLALLISLLVGGIVILVASGVCLVYVLTRRSRRRRGRTSRRSNKSKRWFPIWRSSAPAEGTSTEGTTMESGGIIRVQPGKYRPLATDMGFGFEEPDRMIVFTYKELADATDDFSSANKIGQGAFGVVYYAKLRKREAAIKKMNLVKTQEYQQELKILSKVHHKHLVELIGCCRENFLFLVYEYCEQGTLSNHLHSPAAHGALTWTTRVQAALDAAQALEYIHDHTRPTYVHRDIKSNNILLDKNLRAKVADFGLIKLISQDDQNGPMTTKLVGTFGYMAPEYVKFGDLSPKSDVFSFGVVLLELITGQQALSSVSSQSVVTNSSVSADYRKALTESVVPLIKEMKSGAEVSAIIDPVLRDDYPVDAALQMAQLAAQCTADLAQERPEMKRVVYVLDEILRLSQSGDEPSQKLHVDVIMDSLAR